MTDKPKPRPDTTQSRGGEVRSNTPPAKQFGGRSQEASRKVPPSKVDDDPEAQQSGDRTHETDIRDQTPPMKRSQPTGKEERYLPGNREDEQKRMDVKPSQGQRSGRQGSEAQRDSGKSSEAKPNRNPGGGLSGR